MKNAIFVHGFLGSALNWGPILTNLRRSPDLADWTFSTVDLLGHGGRRSSPLGPYTRLNLDLVAQDLWLQCKDKAPFVALGHSFGLRPILKLYSQHPEAFAGIIVEDSSPVVDPQNYQMIREILTDTPVPFKSRSMAQDFFSKKYPGKLGAFLLSNIREDPDSKTFNWRFDLVGLRDLLDEVSANAQWKEWESIRVPVKIIRGASSDFLTKSRVLEMQSKLKNPADVFEIANAGHWVHSDNDAGFSDQTVKIFNSWGD